MKFLKRALIPLATAGLIAGAGAGVANAWTQGDPANDLLYFRMDDRSVHHLGTNDIWVEWKIKNLAGDGHNHSYNWTWEAVRDSDGAVLNTGAEHQDNVKPAQTVTGQDFTSIVRDEGVHLVITSYTRS